MKIFIIVIFAQNSQKSAFNDNSFVLGGDCFVVSRRQFLVFTMYNDFLVPDERGTDLLVHFLQKTRGRTI